MYVLNSEFLRKATDQGHHTLDLARFKNDLQKMGVNEDAVVKFLATYGDPSKLDVILTKSAITPIEDWDIDIEKYSIDPKSIAGPQTADSVINDILSLSPVAHFVKFVPSSPADIALDTAVKNIKERIVPTNEMKKTERKVKLGENSDEVLESLDMTDLGDFF